MQVESSVQVEKTEECKKESMLGLELSLMKHYDAYKALYHGQMEE